MHFKLILKMIKLIKMIITIIPLISALCFATESEEWASDLRHRSVDLVWQNLQEQMNDQEQGEGRWRINSEIGQAKIAREFAGLYIFVSSSMPKVLLKEYLHQANIYGGVLVFKGLPNDSFKELSKLVTELIGDASDALEQGGRLQIDDQAFEQFGVMVVPTIILSRADDYHPNQVSELIFDKMEGNVGIKYALEQFSHSGQLADKALVHLADGHGSSR